MFPSNSNSNHNRTLLFVKSIVTSWGDPGSPMNGRRSVSGYTEGDTVTYTSTRDTSSKLFATHILGLFRYCLDHNSNAHARLPMSSVCIRCVFQCEGDVFVLPNALAGC